MLARKLDGIDAVAAAYRSGERSPVDETRAALARAHEVEPDLNAFVTLWDESAIRDAEAAERELRSGIDRGPLHGVPVAVKDLIDVQGSTATYGSRAEPARLRPDRDAAIVGRLREAGAVLLGKTNLLEYAYGIVHPAFGQTNNPWDPARTAGGSSGGSAAAVAAGICRVAIGTDTGGSIRIPAAYCGVAGLKPSYGRLSLDGIFPLSWTLDHVGPITADGDDLAAVWAALVGEDRLDRIEPPAGPIRIGVLERYLSGPEMEPEVAERSRAAFEAAHDAGHAVEAVDAKLLDDCDEHLIALVLPEASAIHAQTLSASADRYADGTRQQLEKGFTIPATAYLAARAYRSRLRDEIDALLERYDVLMAPTAPWIAPAEDPPIDSDSGDAEGRRTAPFNLSGHPTVTVNVGFARGLPVGVQVVAKHGRDAKAIAVARRLERTVGAEWPDVGR